MEELDGVPPANEALQDTNIRMETLKEKVNIDQAAIDEARAAVGDDEEKIKEYLINNRGL
jgi:predicted  nucleic acid-binding Zn-ribbon protein